MVNWKVVLCRGGSRTVDYDCRVIFTFVKNKVLLIDIGTHDEVY